MNNLENLNNHQLRSLPLAQVELDALPAALRHNICLETNDDSLAKAAANIVYNSVVFDGEKDRHEAARSVYEAKLAVI